MKRYRQQASEFNFKWRQQHPLIGGPQIKCVPQTPPIVPAITIAQELENISKLLELSEGIGLAADTLETMGFILSPTQPVTPGDGKYFPNISLSQNNFLSNEIVTLLKSKQILRFRLNQISSQVIVFFMLVWIKYFMTLCCHHLKSGQFQI